MERLRCGHLDQLALGPDRRPGQGRADLLCPRRHQPRRHHQRGDGCRQCAVGVHGTPDGLYLRRAGRCEDAQVRLDGDPAVGLQHTGWSGLPVLREPEHRGLAGNRRDRRGICRQRCRSGARECLRRRLHRRLCRCRLRRRPAGQPVALRRHGRQWYLPRAFAPRNAQSPDRWRSTGDLAAHHRAAPAHEATRGDGRDRPLAGRHRHCLDAGADFLRDRRRQLGVLQYDGHAAGRHYLPHHQDSVGSEHRPADRLHRHHGEADGLVRRPRQERREQRRLATGFRSDDFLRNGSLRTDLAERRCLQPLRYEPNLRHGLLERTLEADPEHHRGLLHLRRYGRDHRSSLPQRRRQGSPRVGQ
eukprot:Opistho-1_new@68391